MRLNAQQPYLDLFLLTNSFEKYYDIQRVNKYF
jgi:hypothetical protein